MNRVFPPPMAIGHPRPEAIDVLTPAFEAQVAEHVIERPIRHHQDDDVVDLAEVFLHDSHPVSTRVDRFTNRAHFSRCPTQRVPEDGMV